MNSLRYLRISLGGLFVLFTFAALSCIALLQATDKVSWLVGGVLWGTIIVTAAIAVVPQHPRRPFCLAFLLVSLLHLGVMAYSARWGYTSFDFDLPTWYLIEVMWEAVPPTHWTKGVDPNDYSPELITGLGRIRAVAHENFRGIATQLFSLFFGMLAGWLAQNVAREVSITEPRR